MTNKGLGEKILQMRETGATYAEIQDALGCSKGTISHHLGEGQKKKAAERQRSRRGTLEGAVKHRTEIFQRDLPVSSRPTDYKNPRAATRIASDKVGNFCRDHERREREHSDFTYQDVLDKYGENTVCYLTGDEIDLSDPRSYEFDHVVPRKLGGANSLDNLGIATKNANRAKGAMTVEEFVALCRKVVDYYDGCGEDG